MVISVRLLAINCNNLLRIVCADDPIVKINVIHTGISCMQKHRTFLVDIHRLRAIAILLIVATHCLYFFTWNQHRLIEATLYDLFDDSSVIFMFISGYLFLHGSNTYSYVRYLIIKSKNVILPYLLAAIPAIAFSFRHPDNNVFNTPVLRDLPVMAKTLYLYTYPGSSINYALWFIPVIIIFYFASPLLLWFSRQPRWYVVLGVLIPLSAAMHRPSYGREHNFALALYFLSAYLLGMSFCQYRNQTLAWINRSFNWLLVGFLCLFISHLLLSEHHGKYTFVQWFEFKDEGVIDWTYLQKLLMTMVLLGVVWRLRNTHLYILDYLADVSFTIFFLHVYIIFLVGTFIHWNYFEVTLPAYLMLFFAAVIGPCIVASLSRRLVPAWSRSLVGS